MHFPAQCHFSSWAVNCQESNPGLQPNFHSPWPITQTLRWKNAIFICTWNHSVLQSGEVGYRAGVGGTQQSGYPVVHPRAHARSAPHGADSGEARQSPICGDAVLATPHTRSNGSNKLQQNTTTLSLLTPLFLASLILCCTMNSTFSEHRVTLFILNLFFRVTQTAPQGRPCRFSWQWHRKVFR